MNPAPAADPVDRDFARFRVALAGATLAMLGLSWPLWVGGADFPQVPFVRGWPQPGRVLAWGLVAAQVGAVLAVLLGRGGRWAWGLGLTVATALILGDQGRLQPWMQQYLAVALAAATTTKARALDLARWYVIVLYAASALSKLDAAFVAELGGTFLRAGGHLVGLAPESWPPAARTAATLAMPAGELAVAVALATPGLRAWGLAGSAAQHGATIAILGPWALDHSGNVLVWNAAVLVENLILFGPGQASPSFGPGPRRLAAALVLALVALERSGFVDSWPAHALYASHAERPALFWPATEADRLPPAVRRWLGPPDDSGARRLDLTAWSRAERGVPVYPQNRVACGIAEALVERYAAPDGPPVRLVLLGRAGPDRRSPRARVECVGLAAIRRRADRSWINARPAPGFGSADAPPPSGR